MVSSSFSTVLGHLLCCRNTHTHAILSISNKIAGCKRIFFIRKTKSVHIYLQTCHMLCMVLVLNHLLITFNSFVHLMIHPISPSFIYLSLLFYLFIFTFLSGSKFTSLYSETSKAYAWPSNVLSVNNDDVSVIFYSAFTWPSRAVGVGT